MPGLIVLGSLWIYHCWSHLPVMKIQMSSTYFHLLNKFCLTLNRIQGVGPVHTQHMITGVSITVWICSGCISFTVAPVFHVTYRSFVPYQYRNWRNPKTYHIRYHMLPGLWPNIKNNSRWIPLTRTKTLHELFDMSQCMLTITLVNLCPNVLN